MPLPRAFGSLDGDGRNRENNWPAPYGRVVRALTAASPRNRSARRTGSRASEDYPRMRRHSVGTSGTSENGYGEVGRSSRARPGCCTNVLRCIRTDAYCARAAVYVLPEEYPAARAGPTPRRPSTGCGMPGPRAGNRITSSAADGWMTGRLAAGRMPVARSSRRHQLQREASNAHSACARRCDGLGDRDVSLARGSAEGLI